MIALYTFGAYFGFPDGSPFVTKAMLLLKLAGLPYKEDPWDNIRALSPFKVAGIERRRVGAHHLPFRPKTRRSSLFAASSFLFRSALKFLPALLM
jgi:hypothetical protein